MVFCNEFNEIILNTDFKVTILILIDGFLQLGRVSPSKRAMYVTILILIDGFLQYTKEYIKNNKEVSHNPYFNRWFSAISLLDKKQTIKIQVTILILIDGFLQCSVFLNIL